MRDGKTGKVKLRRKINCHTFLKNFAEMAQLLFIKGDTFRTATIKDSGGTSRSIVSQRNIYAYTERSAAAAYYMRCHIGDSSVAFDRDQYNVISQVTILQYTNYTLSDDGTEKKLTVSFAWTNTSGETKNITEACLLIYLYDAAVTARLVAITRDVFTAVNLNDGDVIALGYQITIPW